LTPELPTAVVVALLKIESDMRGVDGAIEGVTDFERSRSMGRGAGLDLGLGLACVEIAGLGGATSAGAGALGAGAGVGTGEANGMARVIGIEANKDWAKTASSRPLLQGMFKAAAAWRTASGDKGNMDLEGATPVADWEGTWEG